jgi:hypothetical protein
VPTVEDLFDILVGAKDTDSVRLAIESFEAAHSSRVKWVPFGGRPNNRGAIDLAADPGRSIVERLTNSVDAVLELEWERHHGKPDCRSPREAATAWLGVPPGGLSGLSIAQRRELANRVCCSLLDGEGPESRIVEIRDFGTGVAPGQMESTILSLNESNKVEKHYVAGLYGQGGSSTFAASQFTAIASRYADQSVLGFTVVKYEDLPPEKYRTGRYVYLTLDNSVLQVGIPKAGFPSGTLVRHFGYDLSGYPNPIGEKSVYGLLNRVLFDPILPVFLDNQALKTRQRRVIKGARNALSGAVDEGDEETSGPPLSHRMPLSNVSLGDWGIIGIEYWVLDPSKGGSNPTRAFVEPRRPIVLTLNGQNHGELTRTLISREAELPYLAQRTVCHVNCDGLSAQGKRALFVSTREAPRAGSLHDIVTQEVIRALRSDDELVRLNAEARERNYQAGDEAAAQQLRKDVANLLRLQGFKLEESVAGAAVKGKGEEMEKIHTPRAPHPPPLPLEIHEPPTYVRLLWEATKAITFYPGQRRYIRVETDANSTYHDPTDPSRSRFNVILDADGGVSGRGTTALQGGRMRLVTEAKPDARVGTKGKLRIELSRPGLPALADERETEIILEPPSEPSSHKMSLPPFDVRGIDRSDPRWADPLDWPDDVEKVASEAQIDNGKLVVFYSTEFPRFASSRAAFEKRDPELAKSFTHRYEAWLAVHSLILHQGAQPKPALVEGATAPLEMGPEAEEQREREERIRVAVLSTLFASREVRLAKGEAAGDAE